VAQEVFVMVFAAMPLAPGRYRSTIYRRFTGGVSFCFAKPFPDGIATSQAQARELRSASYSAPSASGLTSQLAAAMQQT